MADADSWQCALALVTALSNADGEAFDIVAAHADLEVIRLLGVMAVVSLGRWCDVEGVDVPGLLEDLREEIEERHRGAG